MISNCLLGQVVRRRTCNAKIARSIRVGGTQLLLFFATFVAWLLCSSYGLSFSSQITTGFTHALFWSFCVAVSTTHPAFLFCDLQNTGPASIPHNLFAATLLLWLIALRHFITQQSKRLKQRCGTHCM